MGLQRDRNEVENRRRIYELMTNTIRIYNRRLKKAQRYDLRRSGYDSNGVSINHVGIPFTWRSYICMGNCRIHKDHTKDQRLLRKKRSEQFRFDLKNCVY
jgi:hypothetical protein